jgi:5-formyltetrahydrofolate cyclo-ligase
MKKGELRTGAIVDDLLLQCACGSRRHANANGSEQGAVHALPAPAASQADQDTPLMEMLRLYSPADFAGCPLDKWGILDPGTGRRDAGHEGERREDGALASAAYPWPIT